MPGKRKREENEEEKSPKAKKIKSDGWSCKKCTLWNEKQEFTKMCEMCHTPRSTLGTKKLRVTTVSEESNWACGACSYINCTPEEFQQECKMCQNPRKSCEEPEKKSILIEKRGDLLKSEEQYIAHQSNTTTVGARGLAKALFKRFPYANVYGNNKGRRVCTIEIRGTEAQKRIIAMYAQKGPGKYMKAGENMRIRETWFRECLREVAKISDLKSVAFPHRIGCGLAGGNWSRYKTMIREELVEKVKGIKVVIYQLPNSK